MMERITTILGAGAVLDFDFQPDEIVPRTDIITEEVDKILIKDFMDGQRKPLVKFVHQALKEAHYETQNPARTPEAREIINPINFETLFHVFESLLSLSSVWKDEWISPKVFPPIAAFVDCKESFEKYNTTLYHMALVRMENRICEIVDSYDTKFATKKEYAAWYKNFWHQYAGILDVFTLNYDTTIEHSLEKYEDGFVKWKYTTKRFEPKRLLENKELTSINHLHGCITYLNQWLDVYRDGYSYNDMFKLASYANKVKKDPWHSANVEYNQSHEAYVQRSILVGMRKPDKIMMSPMNFYHANLVNKICENRALLIVGYSFGDTYVNEYLYKMRLIHGDKRRIVLIDKWFGRKCNAAMWNFINSETNDDLDYRKKLREGDYYAPHVSKKKTLMMFICGFKYAVEHHEDKIREFLMS